MVRSVDTLIMCMHCLQNFLVISCLLICTNKMEATLNRKSKNVFYSTDNCRYDLIIV